MEPNRRLTCLTLFFFFCLKFIAVESLWQQLLTLAIHTAMDMHMDIMI